MSKRILFRVKNLNTGKWEYSYAWVGRAVCFKNLLKYIDETVVDISTASEYIGLSDKNDTKIFDGDIIKTKYGRLCIIKWFPRKACWDMSPIETEENLGKEPPAQWDLWYKENLEVVGNIYDNPELLNFESNKKGE